MTAGLPDHKADGCFFTVRLISSGATKIAPQAVSHSVLTRGRLAASLFSASM